MADYQTDAPPPYYSVTGAAQRPPPYSPANGVQVWHTPPTHPQYAPQPVATPVIIPHVGPPSRKFSRRGRAGCYGASLCLILTFTLLGIAVWVGMKYGLIWPDDDDKESSPTDTCPDHTVLCNGYSDCSRGSDESICVRFGAGGQLQIKTSTAGGFLPVCSQGWSSSLTDLTCSQLGLTGSHTYGSMASSLSKSLSATDPKSSDHIQGRLTVSSSCPAQQTVTLECTNCGQPQSSSRIIGGEVAQLGDWPWQVSLHFQGFHTCGGSLISPDFVISAAHCFSSSSAKLASNWRVYVGTVSQLALSTSYLVETIVLHKDYSSQSNDHDIALLKLRRPVSTSENVQPVCLPVFSQTFAPGTRCWTTGFGTTVQGAVSGSTSLMEVPVDIISSSDCNSWQVYDGHITNNMLCAGDLDGGRDSCQGDSGGPLVCEDRGRWYLAGITSWGEGCGQRNRPGVYAKVSSLLSWIYSNTQQEGS
ncbi:transmembrane protease serine 13-like [Sardina pilchardus]|uniref:transmembrane protease serine 13-like n=1 Tax=Sardina pilchardus TaxID=27697 RepID=UPI002E15F187